MEQDSLAGTRAGRMLLSFDSVITYNILRTVLTEDAPRDQ